VHCSAKNIKNVSYIGPKHSLHSIQILVFKTGAEGGTGKNIVTHSCIFFVVPESPVLSFLP
jgi:hypothetical protein